MAGLYLIYLDNSVLISKKDYASWREIQDSHVDYKASLGPWDATEIVDYLAAEYPELHPAAEQQVALLVSGTADVRVLTFGAQPKAGHD